MGSRISVKSFRDNQQWIKENDGVKDCQIKEHLTKHQREMMQRWFFYGDINCKLPLTILDKLMKNKNWHWRFGTQQCWLLILRYITLVNKLDCLLCLPIDTDTENILNIQASYFLRLFMSLPAAKRIFVEICKQKWSEVYFQQPDG